MNRSPSALDDALHFLEARFHRQIRDHRILEASPGDFSPLPKNLDPRLRRVLEDDGITQLYAHQAEAFDAIQTGRDVVLVSRTASGKTLSFLLPLLNRWMQDEAPFTVLLLYPTKALSRDQENTLGRLLRAGVDRQKLGTFDGDTPRDERRNIQRSADFVITNPDMLHAGILPNHHRGWKSFLSRLKYIVVDEVHSYRGAFGSHVANVFRRLLRVCEMHGSRPTFIGCSATVGNPGEHVEALFHRKVQVIDRDGAPRPARDLYLVNPPLVQSAGAALYRKGPASISIPLMREATRLGVRTICFCRARQEVERLYRAVVDGRPELAGRIKPYRGGLLPNERRQLERDLFGGTLTTIITTNALELGIDIGDLDLCILSGHPGTVASFWQQAGRVGRKGARAAIVFIAKDTPIDQYLVNHPDFITRAPIEQAWLNGDNPYILLQHLPCAAHEVPLRPEEPAFTDRAYTIALNVLTEEKTLAPYHDSLRYALPDYPAKGVNLRGMTDYNVDIYCGTEVIGEIDPIGARGTLYKDAIYQHLGRRYMSMDLDLEKKLCRVDEVSVDYYTEAVWENRVELTEAESETQRHGATLRYGYIHVNKQPKLYKKIRERSYENIGYGPITLPPFEYDTTGFTLQVPPAWRKALDEKDRRYLGAALYGLSYLLHRAAPNLCMADAQDIETDVSLFEEEAQTWQSALYLYDAHEGGVGYAEKICEKIEEALTLCRDILRDCECEAGCPACVPPLPPGVENEELERLLIESNAAQACTQSLLDVLLDGTIALPELRTIQRRHGPLTEPPPEDEETKKLSQRLHKAADILKRKREREH
ncbi:MAG TPA: DEAD/DEAH box helicase [Kiritimatiellia bacterium]|nr:DEAD/DEAH box helicase [Kiritimatiellia bacterium]HMP96113.1 DEAD/DEAH box helicase [Kiritimatiellia bacterium]